MEVYFSPELEEQLALSAAVQGRKPDELVRAAVSRYLSEGTRIDEPGRLTGAALVAAMQASPYKEIELQPGRDRSPVRDAVL
jgi:hypothetical protein